MVNITRNYCGFGLRPSSNIKKKPRELNVSETGSVSCYLPLTKSCLRYLYTVSSNWALLDKPWILRLLKNFPAFYRTRRFIFVFTRTLHWSLSWAKSIQSITSHPISLRYVLILSTNHVLVFPVVSFLLAFPPISYTHSSSPHSC
jgi:hypothetical protein